MDEAYSTLSSHGVNSLRHLVQRNRDEKLFGVITIALYRTDDGVCSRPRYGVQ